jgi:hypothetical protein
MNDVKIAFDAPPTVARFMESTAMFRLIAGPVGSGKTTGCIFELLRRAIEQSPAPDGLRYTRFAIVRQTLKQLKDTVLKDIISWLKGLVSYKVTDNMIYVSFGNVRSEWLLIPLDEPEDQRRLLSMQLTGAWLSECIEMNHEIVAPVLGRCGRYPSAALGGSNWYGAIADTNMPTEGTPWHRLMAIETPPHWQIFIQPGGMSDDAENLDYLLQNSETLKLSPGHPDRIAQGRKYYINQIQANIHQPAWVERYVHARYGEDPSGSAVHRQTFKRGFHTVSLTKEMLAQGAKHAIEPSPGYPLIVVQDFGRNPSALICQSDHKGRALVLEEIVAKDIGLELHITQNLLPALNKERYINRQFYVIGDPAGRAKGSTFEETSFDTLKRHGLRSFPAPTNDPDKRISAVDSLLLQQRDGGAALLIDADLCPVLVLALASNYRYARRRNDQLSPRPEKLHPWSDVADCLQYFCLAVQGGFHEYVANRIERQVKVMAAGPRARMPSRAWT